MAKAVGFIGTISGKSGNVVFAKGANGQTIMRPYQPVVYNPKSSGQSLQRAKMCLAAGLSKVCPAEVLSSLSLGRKLANRSFFTKNILRRAASNYDSDEHAYQAAILGEDIIFGRGAAVTRVAFTSTTIRSTAVDVTFDTSNVPADDLGKVGVRFIALVANKTGGQSFEACNYADVVIDVARSGESVSIPVPTLTENSSYVGIYMVPFELTEDAAQQYSASLGYGNSQNLLFAMMRSESSMVKSWGDSALVEDFTPFENA